MPSESTFGELFSVNAAVHSMVSTSARAGLPIHLPRTLVELSEAHPAASTEDLAAMVEQVAREFWVPLARR